MSSLTRPQQRALGVLRGLLRHARTKLDSRPSGGAAHDASQWTSFIMATYRANQAVTNRTQQKLLRQQASDMLELVSAVGQQKELIDAFRGVDIERKGHNRAVARFVGLEMPQVPGGDALPGRSAAQVADKYAEDIVQRVSGAPHEASGLSGIDNIKAQLFGIEATLRDARGPGSSVADPSAGGAGAEEDVIAAAKKLAAERRAKAAAAAAAAGGSSSGSGGSA